MKFHSQCNNTVKLWLFVLSKKVCRLFSCKKKKRSWGILLKAENQLKVTSDYKRTIKCTTKIGSLHYQSMEHSWNLMVIVLGWNKPQVQYNNMLLSRMYKQKRSSCPKVICRFHIKIVKQNWDFFMFVNWCWNHFHYLMMIIFIYIFFIFHRYLNAASQPNLHILFFFFLRLKKHWFKWKNAKYQDPIISWTIAHSKYKTYMYFYFTFTFDTLVYEPVLILTSHHVTY